MTNDDRPNISGGMDPLGHIVVTVRGDSNAPSPDYELPPAVTLDQASKVLGLNSQAGLVDAQNGTYPVPVIGVGKAGFRVGTGHLIKAVGLDRVRDALRPQE